MYIAGVMLFMSGLNPTFKQAIPCPCSKLSRGRQLKNARPQPGHPSANAAGYEVAAVAGYHLKAPPRLQEADIYFAPSRM